MNCHAVIFPFDLFGSGGSAAGAKLLGDLLHEILDDTRNETRPTRQHALLDGLTIEEVPFDELPQLNRWQAKGRDALVASLKVHDFTLWLSGNHLGCLPIYQSDEDFVIVQFDAHLDCYDMHDTHSSLSHGNFVRETKRPVINLGHRDLFLPAMDINNQFRLAISAEELATDEAASLARLKKAIGKANVWLDIDCDVFDPAIFPATHQPLPFGLTSRQLLRFIHAIPVTKLIGASVSEYDPSRDRDDVSLAVAGWFIEWLLLRKRGA